MKRRFLTGLLVLAMLLTLLPTTALAREPEEPGTPEPVPVESAAPEESKEPEEPAAPVESKEPEESTEPVESTEPEPVESTEPEPAEPEPAPVPTETPAPENEVELFADEEQTEFYVGGENPGTDIGAFEVDPENTTIEEFEAKGFNKDGSKYWVLDYGDATDFDSEAVEYTFASNS